MSDEKNQIDEHENEAGDEEEENETDNSEEPKFVSYDDEEENGMENIANERSPKPEAPAIAPQMRPARRGGGFMDGIRQPAMPLQAPAPARTKLGFGVPPVPPAPPPVEQKTKPKVEAKPEPKVEAKPEELVLNLQQSDFEAFAKDEPTYKPAILSELGGFNGVAIAIQEIAMATKAKAEEQKPLQAYIMRAVTKLLEDTSLSQEQIGQYKLVAWYVMSTLFVGLGVKSEIARAEARKVVEGIVAKKLAKAADQDRNAMNGPPPMPKAKAKPEEAAKPEAEPVEPPKEEPKAEAKAETKAEPKSEPKPEAGKVIQLRRPADAAIAPTVEAPTPAPLSQPSVQAAAKTTPPAGPKTPTPAEVRAKVGAEVAKGGFGRPEPLAPAAGATHPVVPPDPSALPPAPIRDRVPAIPEPPVVKQHQASGPHPAAIAANAIQQVEMQYSPIKPEPRLPTENAADKPTSAPTKPPTAKPEEKPVAKPAAKGEVSTLVVLLGCALMLALGALVFLGYVHYGPKPQAPTAAPVAQRQLVCEHVTPALIKSHFNQSDPAHFPNPGPRQSGKPYIECHGQQIFHDPARNTFDVRKCDVCYWK